MHPPPKQKTESSILSGDTIFLVISNHFSPLYRLVLKRREKMIMKYIKKVGLIFFSGLFIGCCFFLMVSFLLKVSIRSSSIKKYVDENDFAFLVKTSSGEDSKLLKETKSFLQDIGVSSSVIDEIIKSDVMKKYITNYTVLSILYYLGEGEEPKVDISFFKKVFKENIQITSWIMETNSKQERHAKMKVLEEKFDKYATHIIDFVPPVKNFLKRLEGENTYLGLTFKQILALISLMMSKKWIISVVILMWLSLVFIFVCGENLLTVYHSLFVSFLVFTSVLIIIEILLGTVLKTKLMERLESANVFINYMVNVLSKDIWVFVIVGILMCIFFKKYPQLMRKKILTRNE